MLLFCISSVSQSSVKKKKWKKMPELIKQEEEDSELNCSKSDKDLESDNKSILIDTPKINENISKQRKI